MSCNQCNRTYHSKDRAQNTMMTCCVNASECFANVDCWAARLQKLRYLRLGLIAGRVDDACLSKPLAAQRAAITRTASQAIGICAVARNRLSIIDTQ